MVWSGGLFWVYIPLVIFITTKVKAEAPTCFVPSVKRGEKSNVTCDFHEDVSKLVTATLTVGHYPQKSSTETPVLGCHWIESNNPTCTPAQGYTFDEKFGRTLRLDIENPSEKHTGRYVCKVMTPTSNPSPEPCEFKLADDLTTIKEPSTTDDPRIEKGNTSYVIIAAVIAVGAVIFIAAVILFYKCYWKKRASSDGGAGNTTVPELKKLMDKTRSPGDPDNDPGISTPGDEEGRSPGAEESTVDNTQPGDTDNDPGASTRNEGEGPHPGTEERSTDNTHPRDPDNDPGASTRNEGEGPNPGPDERSTDNTQDEPSNEQSPENDGAAPVKCTPLDTQAESSVNQNVPWSQSHLRKTSDARPDDNNS